MTNIYVNNASLINLKNNFKLNTKQAIEKLENIGFSLFNYRQARSYKLDHGYFSLYFADKKDNILMLQSSNNEETSLSLYACLRLSNFLFCPIFEVFKIKSYGVNNSLTFQGILSNLDQNIMVKLDRFASLINSLENKELNAFTFQAICSNSVKYRNFKLKSNRYFHFIPESNGFNLLVTLLSELLTSKSNNNEYHSLIENMRQLNNITSYTIDQIMKA